LASLSPQGLFRIPALLVFSLQALTGIDQVSPLPVERFGQFGLSGGGAMQAPNHNGRRYGAHRVEQDKARSGSQGSGRRLKNEMLSRQVPVSEHIPQGCDGDGIEQYRYNSPLEADEQAGQDGAGEKVGWTAAHDTHVDANRHADTVNQEDSCTCTDLVPKSPENEKAPSAQINGRIDDDQAPEPLPDADDDGRYEGGQRKSKAGHQSSEKDRLSPFGEGIPLSGGGGSEPAAELRFADRLFLFGTLDPQMVF
jgi:hypothetical protein